MVHLRSRLAAFIRHKRGDTPQRLFARKLGLAQSTIMRIENEDQNVTLHTLEQLCKAFHVDVAELFPALDVRRSYQIPVKKSVYVKGAGADMIHESQLHTKTVSTKAVATKKAVKAKDANTTAVSVKKGVSGKAGGSKKKAPVSGSAAAGSATGGSATEGFETKGSKVQRSE